MDVIDYVTGGVLGRDLWTLLLYQGAALCSFGPTKLKNFERPGKGCGRTKAKAKGIKTSEEGNHLLSCMRDYLEEVMERLKKVTQMDISENTVMGLNDRGRSLLIFRFKDSHLATFIFPMIRTLPSTIGCYCASCHRVVGLPQRQIMIWKYWI